MADTHKTEIAIVLDRSGSMESIRDDMEGGLSAFIQGQRSEPGECVISLYQFDDKFEVVCEASPLTELRPPRLVPRGATALLDGVGKSIALIGERHAKLADGDKPAAVIILVITDGHENASTEWDLRRVRKAVEHAQTHRKWRFVFLGADAAAFDEGASMGFATAARYTASGDGVAAACDAVLLASRMYRGSVREGDLEAAIVLEKDLSVVSASGKRRKRSGKKGS